MSSIFHATLGKYVACMDLQEKEPWMKDQEHILQMIVNTAVFSDLPSGSVSGGRGKAGITWMGCAFFVTLLPVLF